MPTVAVKLPLFDQCLADFLNKEKVSFGYLENSVEEPVGYFFHKHCGEQVASLLAGERKQVDRDCQPFLIEV